MIPGIYSSTVDSLCSTFLPFSLLFSSLRFAFLLYSSSFPFFSFFSCCDFGVRSCSYLFSFSLLLLLFLFVISISMSIKKSVHAKKTTLVQFYSSHTQPTPSSFTPHHSNAPQTSPIHYDSLHSCDITHYHLILTLHNTPRHKARHS